MLPVSHLCVILQRPGEAWKKFALFKVGFQRTICCLTFSICSAAWILELCCKWVLPFDIWSTACTVCRVVKVLNSVVGNCRKFCKNKQNVFISMKIDALWAKCLSYRGELRLQESYVSYSRGFLWSLESPSEGKESRKIFSCGADLCRVSLPYVIWKSWCLLKKILQDFKFSLLRGQFDTALALQQMEVSVHFLEHRRGSDCVLFRATDDQLSLRSLGHAYSY